MLTHIISAFLVRNKTFHDFHHIKSCTVVICHKCPIKQFQDFTKWMDEIFSPRYEQVERSAQGPFLLVACMQQENG